MCDLLKEDNVMHIIYALKKTPGMVSYKEGRLNYTNIMKKKWFRFFDSWFNKIAYRGMAVLTVISILLMAFSSGGEFFAYLVLVVFSSSILAYTVRQQRYDILVESLVENEHNNGN